MTGTPCAICENNSQAAFHVRWGTDDQQVAALCEQHTQEVWETAKNQIAAGVCFWIQEKCNA